MIIVPPISLSPGDLVLPGHTPQMYSEWSPLVVYEAGDRVSTVDGRGWIAAITSYKPPGSAIVRNQGIDPITEEGFFLPYGSQVSPISCLKPNSKDRSFWWVPVLDASGEDLSYDPAYKCLYQPLYEQTTAANTLSVRLSPRYAVDAVCLFNVTGTSASVSISGQSQVQNLVLSNGYTRKDCAFLGLPAYVAGEGSYIDIVIGNPGGTAGLGYICAGRQHNTGMSVYGITMAVTDFSRKERYFDGSTLIIPREYTFDTGYIIDPLTSHIGQIQRLLAKLRTVPSAFIAHPSRQETLVFGYYSDFTLPISSYSHTECAISIKGLV